MNFKRTETFFSFFCNILVDKLVSHKWGAEKRKTSLKDLFTSNIVKKISSSTAQNRSKVSHGHFSKRAFFCATAVGGPNLPYVPSFLVKFCHSR